MGGVRTPRKEGGVGGGVSGQGSGIATPEGGKVHNEALASYFAGLLKEAKGSSEGQNQSESPYRGSSLAGGRAV